jgi:hypothetical protein
MKYTIRKRENVTLYLASDPVELNTEAFRSLEENPYVGSSEEDFLKYIEDFHLHGETPAELDEESAIELQKLSFDAEMNEFDNSAQKFADTWLESGEIDKKYSKYGDFNASHSTKN